MDAQATAPAQAVFREALSAVVGRGHDSVRAEHILLGLLALGAGAAAEALDAFQVDRSSVRARLESTLPPASPGGAEGEYPYHPTGLALLQAAVGAAMKTSHGTLNSASVLLAVLTTDGPARRALETAGAPVAELAALAESGVDDPDD